MYLFAWQVLQIISAIPLVALPIFVQAKESLDEPARPVSLGTFGIVMMCATWFAVAGLINAVVVSRLLGWHWAVALLLGVAASATGAAVASSLLYTMATVGGRGLTFAGTAMIAAMVLVNVMGPRWARGIDYDHRTTILPN